MHGAVIFRAGVNNLYWKIRSDVLKEAGQLMVRLEILKYNEIT